MSESLILILSLCSHLLSLHRYGPGPYLVEIELSFNGNSDRSNKAYITMELATADQMPQTVLWFLEQVDTGIYNFAEFAFTSSVEHLVLAKPVTEGLVRRMEEFGLYRIVFPEYSSDFKHVKYSVGLSGRPGGPNFYINMDDNSRHHGPGGYAADGSGDPCFGRITRGLDAVDRLHVVQGDGWTELNPNVYILSMKILSSK